MRRRHSRNWAAGMRSWMNQQSNGTDVKGRPQHHQGGPLISEHAGMCARLDRAFVTRTTAKTDEEQR